jgi:hypothetical protein
LGEDSFGAEALSDAGELKETEGNASADAGASSPITLSEQGTAKCKSNKLVEESERNYLRRE